MVLPALIKFFQVLQASKSKTHTYVSLQTSLLGSADEKLPVPNRAAISQCIAGMSAKADQKEVAATVDKFIADIKNTAAKEHSKHIALLTLGEIGQTRDLSDYKGIETVVFSAFDSKVSGRVLCVASCCGRR